MTDTATPPSLDSVVARIGDGIESTAGTGQQNNSRLLPLCQCSRKYSDVISQLQTIEERQRPIKLDTLLTCANVVLALTHSRIQCCQCPQDTRVFMQLIIIFQTLLTWTKIQCRPTNNTCSEVRMVLGRHELTSEECGFVASGLLARVLQRTSSVLGAMMARAEQISINPQERRAQSQGGTDLRTYQQLTRSLLHVCRSLLKGFSSAKAL